MNKDLFGYILDEYLSDGPRASDKEIHPTNNNLLNLTDKPNAPRLMTTEIYNFEIGISKDITETENIKERMKWTGSNKDYVYAELIFPYVQHLLKFQLYNAKPVDDEVYDSVEGIKIDYPEGGYLTCLKTPNNGYIYIQDVESIDETTGEVISIGRSAIYVTDKESFIYINDKKVSENFDSLSTQNGSIGIELDLANIKQAKSYVLFRDLLDKYPLIDKTVVSINVYPFESQYPTITTGIYKDTSEEICNEIKETYESFYNDVLDNMTWEYDTVDGYTFKILDLIIGPVSIDIQEIHAAIYDLFNKNILRENNPESNVNLYQQFIYKGLVDLLATKIGKTK